MELISEKTISDLYKSGSLVSGITQKALTKRLNSGNSRIELHSAIVNIKKKFIELQKHMIQIIILILVIHFMKINFIYLKIRL